MYVIDCMFNFAQVHVPRLFGFLTRGKPSSNPQSNQNGSSPLTIHAILIHVYSFTTGTHKSILCAQIRSSSRKSTATEPIYTFGSTAETKQAIARAILIDFTADIKETRMATFLR
jgi:hypothetical protein